MNNRTWICLLLLVFCCIGPASAQEQTITLRDGTVMKGELVQVENGVYTIQSSSLGQTQIKAEEIASINTGTTPAANTAASTPQPSMNAQMQQLQSTIMANPDMMADIQSIAADPDVVKLITTPGMLQAITSKDVEALKNNPAAQQLMQNPKIQMLIERLKSTQQPAASDQ